MSAKLDLVEFMQDIPVFARFTPQELVVLEQAMSVDEYPDGHEFINENKTNDRVYLVVEGHVIATRRRARLRGLDVFNRYQPGELFGVMALIDRRFPWASFRAEGPVTAASLQASAFDLLFRTHVHIACSFQYLVARQLVRNVHSTIEVLDTLFAGAATDR